MVYYAVYTAVILKLCTMKSVVVFLVTLVKLSKTKVAPEDENNSQKMRCLVKPVQL